MGAGKARLRRLLFVPCLRSFVSGFIPSFPFMSVFVLIPMPDLGRVLIGEKE